MTYGEIARRELEQSFAGSQYSPEAAVARNKEWVLGLLEELTECIQNYEPVEPDFRDVGDLSAIRVHLEKSLGHAKRQGWCMECPSKKLNKDYHE